MRAPFYPVSKASPAGLLCFDTTDDNEAVTASTVTREYQADFDTLNPPEASVF